VRGYEIDYENAQHHINKWKKRSKSKS